MNLGKSSLWGIIAILSFALALLVFGVERVLSRRAHPTLSKADLISLFLSKTEASTSFDLSAEFPALRFESFVDPRALLPQADRYPFEQLSAIQRYARDCGSKKPLVREFGLKKALDWAAFECGQQELSADFFDRQPWIDPMGSSYVARALRSSRDRFRSDPIWVQSHLRYLHVLEYREIPEGLGNDRRLFGELDYEGLRSVAAGLNASSLEHVWFRDLSASGQGGFVYRVYSAETWRSFLAAQGWAVNEAVCNDKEEGFCWKDLREERFRNQRRVLGILAALAVLLSAAAVALWLRQQAKLRHLAERQRFAFLMLAHELRTPVTTLTIELERLRERERKLPEQEQDSLLRAFDASQRLRRLSEMSGRYFQAAGSGLLTLSETEVPSLKNYLQAEIDDRDEDIQLRFSIEDRPLRSDWDWFSFCLRNLLNNAAIHGRAPITLAVERWGTQMAVVVEDAGSLHERAATSQKGLGMGLALVERVARELGYRLVRRSSPTRFALVMNRVSQGARS